MNKKRYSFQAIFQKKSILFTWILSYVLLIVVQIGISAISYMRIYAEVETEVAHYAQLNLNSLKKGMRAKLDTIDKILVGISLDPQVLKFLEVEGPIEGEKSYQMIQAMDNIRNYVNGINFTEVVFVYFRNSDMVVTPQEALSASRFFERYIADGTITFAQWKNSLLEEDGNAYQIHRREKTGMEARLEFGQQLPISNRYHKTAVVGVQVKEKTLLDVDDSQIAEYETIYVLGEGDKLICQYGQNSMPQQIRYADMTEPEGTLYHNVEGKKMVETYADIGVHDWKVVSCVRANIFWNKLARLRNISIWSMALVVLLQLIIAYYFMKNSYNPIKELIHSIAENSGEEYSGTKNEYYYIQDTMKDLLKEKTYIASTLRQQKNNMKTEALIKLLKGKFENAAEAYQKLKNVGILLGNGTFTVVVFSNEDISELFIEDTDITEKERFRLSQYILANIVEDLSGQMAAGHVAEIEDMVVCLLETASDAPRDWKETARSLAASVCEATMQHFHMYTAAAYGTGYQNLNQIQTSYIEALEAMEYKQVMDAPGYPCYADIGDAPDSRLYQYSLKDEQNLIEAIQDGDYERAKYVLDKVFQSNFVESQYTVGVVKCFMVDIVCTIMRAVNELAAGDNNMQDFSDMKPVYALLECNSVNHLRKETDDLLQTICTYVKEANKNNTKSIQEGIMEFVQEHYMNVNLNVTYLGEQFSMAPSYLSKQFKAQAGQSILDYINYVRIEKAKELLSSQPDANMDQIAAEVGYSGRITFSRLFKKYVGVTPGIYKETHNKKQ